MKRKTLKLSTNTLLAVCLLLVGLVLNGCFDSATGPNYAKIEKKDSLVPPADTVMSPFLSKFSNITILLKNMEYVEKQSGNYYNLGKMESYHTFDTLLFKGAFIEYLDTHKFQYTKLSEYQHHFLSYNGDPMNRCSLNIIGDLEKKTIDSLDFFYRSYGYYNGYNTKFVLITLIICNLQVTSFNDSLVTFSYKGSELKDRLVTINKNILYKKDSPRYEYHSIDFNGISRYYDDSEITITISK